MTLARVKDSVAARAIGHWHSDIALPRDVEVAVGEMDNVFCTISTICALPRQRIERREENVPAAQHIIAQEAQRYWDWVPASRRFRWCAVSGGDGRVRSTELAAALRRLGPMAEGQAEEIEYFSRALMNKLLHEPSVRLKAAADQRSRTRRRRCRALLVRPGRQDADTHFPSAGGR